MIKTLIKLYLLFKIVEGWIKSSLAPINSSSTNMLVWDTINKMISILIFHLLLVEKCFDSKFFQPNRSLMKMTIIISILINIFDILISMRTIQFFKGRAITNCKILAWKYIKGPLIADFFAVVALFCIYFDLAEGLFAHFDLLIALKALFDYKNVWKRLFDLAALSGKEKVRGGVLLFYLTLMIISALNIASCLWFFLSNIEDDNYPDSWVKALSISGKDLNEKYMQSLFWTLCNFLPLRTGSFTPFNNKELVITCSMNIVGYILMIFLLFFHFPDLFKKKHLRYGDY